LIAIFASSLRLILIKKSDLMLGVYAKVVNGSIVNLNDGKFETFELKDF
jgi:hypothetical protein